MNTSQQCPGSQESQPCPGGHQAQHGQQAREGIVLLCSELGQPHLQCWANFGYYNKKDINLLENSPRRAMRMMKVKGLEGKPCDEQLRSLGLPSLEEIEETPHQRCHEGKRRGRH